MLHAHTVHLPLGALLSPCTMCGTGAQLLLCGLSEFCLTAAMANPHAAYFPYAVAGPTFFAPSPRLDGIRRADAAAGFHWAPVEPGGVMFSLDVIGSSWEAVREFLRG